jgi:prepilin peptidase CpaA
MTVRSSTNTTMTMVDSSSRDLMPGLTAVLVSILVTTCFLKSAGEAPLPRATGAAAFLSAAIVADVRWMRIPNALTLPALGLAIGSAFVMGGAAEGLVALSGMTASLFVFGSAFALGWMGAGDVKATMVLGALWGPIHMASAAWWMFVAGGVLAICMLSAQPGALSDLARRWARSFWYTLRLRRLTYIAPRSEYAGTGLPFAVAMGIGATCAQIWGSPWS